MSFPKIPNNVGPHLKTWQQLNAVLAKNGGTIEKRVSNNGMLNIKKQTDNAINCTISHPLRDKPDELKRRVTNIFSQEGSQILSQSWGNRNGKQHAFLQKTDVETGATYTRNQINRLTPDGSFINTYTETTTGPHVLNRLMPEAVKNGGSWSHVKVSHPLEPIEHQVTQIKPVNGEHQLTAKRKDILRQGSV